MPESVNSTLNDIKNKRINADQNVNIVVQLLKNMEWEFVLILFLANGEWTFATEEKEGNNFDFVETPKNKGIPDTLRPIEDNYKEGYLYITGESDCKYYEFYK